MAGPRCHACGDPATETVGVLPFCGQCAPLVRQMSRERAEAFVQALRQISRELRERTAA